MKLRGWRRVTKMWPSDHGNSWKHAKFGCTVAFDRSCGGYYFYGETVDNSLWNGHSWPTPELAAHQAEAAALAVIDHAKRIKP